MQGGTHQNEGKHFSTSLSGSESVPPVGNASSIPPLAQELLDLAHKILKPLEAYYTSKININLALEQEKESAIALSQRLEVKEMSKKGDLFAFLRFFSTDPSCTWLKKYRAYCQKQRRFELVTLKHLTDHNFYALTSSIVEFYASFATGEKPPLSPLPDNFLELPSSPIQTTQTEVSQEKFSTHEKVKPGISKYRKEEPAYTPPVIIEDRLRTDEEWIALRKDLGESADLVDPIISGKRGQDRRWANAVYDDVIELGQQCSPRFLEMAHETWGLVVDWNNTRHEIINEYDRIAFLNTVNRQIRRQARAIEREQKRQEYLQWLEKRSRKEEAMRSHAMTRKERSHEKSNS